MTCIWKRLPASAVFACILYTSIAASAQTAPTEHCAGSWTYLNGVWSCVKCGIYGRAVLRCEELADTKRTWFVFGGSTLHHFIKQFPKQFGLRLRAASAPHKGVLVDSVEPNSEAAARGIRPGSIVSSVHGSEVSSLDDIIKNIARAYHDGRDAVLMTIDGADVAIPFPDRKGEKLLVLLAEPRPPMSLLEALLPSLWLLLVLLLLIAAGIFSLIFLAYRRVQKHAARAARYDAVHAVEAATQPNPYLVAFFRFFIRIWRAIKGARGTLTGFFTRIHEVLYPKHIAPPNPEKAQHHLKNALDYFDKWEQARDWNDKRNFVRFAAQQIELAKECDVRATYTFIDEDKRPTTWVIKQFSGTALFYQAQNLMNDRFYGRAARVLRRALEFDTDNTQYLNKLAEAHIRGKRRRRARAVLEGVQYPDFRTQELLDRLNADWLLGSRLNSNAVSFLLGAALLYAAYALFDETQWLNWTPIILALLGAVCIWNAQQGSIEDTLKRQGKWPGKTRADHEL